MITKQDISKIISEAYARASLKEDCDMRIVADLFESVRGQLNISNPYKSWEIIILDKDKFNYDFCVELLNDLQESYFNFLFEKQLSYLDDVYESDKSKALVLWMQFYAEATVYYREDMVCMLCYQRLKWEKKSEELAKYAKLPKLIQENRWADAYPFYLEIAANTNLSAELRAYAEITLFQIVLYFYPEISLALKHLENATLLLPDHFVIKRGWAEYYLKTGETNKARNGFLEVIAMKPGDYLSLIYMGDCFLAEAKLENAESWYHDAIQKNFLPTDSYKRLLNLYCNKTWFKEKEPRLESLLIEIEKRQKFCNANQLIEKKLATKECFKDLQLYESYRDVGAAWFTNQNLEKSEEWYNRARSLHPGVATVIIDIAYLKFHQQLPDKAKEFFLQVLETDKENFDAYWGLAYYYEKKDNKEDAIKNYQTCLRLRPHWYAIINNLIGNLHYSCGEYNEASSYYNKAVEANADYSIYRKNLAGAFQGLADQFVTDVNYLEAEKFYLQAVTIDNTSDRWNKFGVFFHNQNRWKEAIGCYEKAIALENNNSLFYENIGLAYEALNKYSEAENAYKQAIEYESKTGRYLDRLGVFYFARQDYDKSIDYYLMALQREPEEPVYYENVALAYEKKEMYSKAVEYYLTALKLNPSSAKDLNAIGLNYYYQQQYKPAIDYYRQALALDGTNWIYLSNLGLALNLAGNRDDAIDVFQKAVKLKEDDYLNWNQLGILFYEKGEQEKAIECYNKSISIQPNDPVLFINLALALYKQGKNEDLLNITNSYSMTPEVKKEVDSMLKQDFPLLFEAKI